MPFKPGHKKIGGREKGSKNKDTVALEEKANAIGIDPFEVLLLFAKGDHVTLDCAFVTPDQRLKAASEACQYLYPKRKALEATIDAADEVGFKIVVEDYSKKNE